MNPDPNTTRSVDDHGELLCTAPDELPTSVMPGVLPDDGSPIAAPSALFTFAAALTRSPPCRNRMK